MSGSQPTEPYWEPLPRSRRSITDTVLIIARHLIPVVGIVRYGWSAGQFLLLSVFNIAFSIACIGVVGVAVSMRRESGASATGGGVRAWASLLAVGVVISLLLTAMFGWVVVVLAGNAHEAVFNRSLALSALAMVVTAAPGLLGQYRVDLRSGLDDESRKRRDQPQVLTLVLCGGIIFVLSGWVADFGRVGLIAMAAAVSALLMLRELRPDLLRELARPAGGSRGG